MTNLSEIQNIVPFLYLSRPVRDAIARGYRESGGKAYDSIPYAVRVVGDKTFVLTLATGVYGYEGIISLISVFDRTDKGYSFIGEELTGYLEKYDPTLKVVPAYEPSLPDRFPRFRDASDAVLTAFARDLAEGTLPPFEPNGYAL